MKKESDMTNITVQVPRKIRTDLKMIALRDGQTIRQIMPTILRDWIAKNK